MQHSKAALATFLILLVLIGATAVFMVRSYVVATIMGGIIALLSFPLHRRLMMRSIRPRISAFLVTIFVVFLVLGPLLIFAALAVKQGLAIAEYISETDALSIRNLLDTMREWEPLAEILGEREMKGQLEKGINAATRGASIIAVTFAKTLPIGLIKLALAALTCYFMLLDGPRFVGWLARRLPLASDVRHRLGDVFHETAISVIWATMTAAGTQAILVTAAFLTLQVPAAFLAGGLTFVFAFVPFLGSVPLWLGGSLFLLIQGSFIRAGLMIVFGIFIATIDNLIRPWILKGRNEMHPMVGLLSIIGGIETFGVFGAFLGPILAALLISLLQIWPVVGQRYGMPVGSESAD